MSNKYDLAVYIGRFQGGPHYGHIQCFNEAAAIAQNVLILIGSANTWGTCRNPFDPRDIENLWNSILANVNAAFHTCQIDDFPYNNNKWVKEVQSTVKYLYPEAKNIVLVGHSKDETSFYLELFPQWDLHKVEPTTDISATDVRQLASADKWDQVGQLVPKQVLEFLHKHICEYIAICKKQNFNTMLFRAKALEHEPSYLAVDAVVLCQGHILLKEDENRLVGGMVGTRNTLDQAILNHIKGKANIKVPPAIIAASITEKRIFDKTDRSRRARIITQAYKIELKEKQLPLIIGPYKWVPIADVLDKPANTFFEDHWFIIDELLA